MSTKLEEAVKLGRAEATDRQRREAETKDKERLEAQRHAAEVEYYKKWLAEDDRIYKLVAKATARGENHLTLDGTTALAEAIRQLDGFTATHRVVEYWNAADRREVTVRWVV